MHELQHNNKSVVAKYLAFFCLCVSQYFVITPELLLSVVHGWRITDHHGILFGWWWLWLCMRSRNGLYTHTSTVDNT